MIPTQYKSRLGRHLSYPIGAEAISNTLADAPHAVQFYLTFYHEAVSPASEFQRLLTERSPYRIVEAEHQPARKPGYSAANSMIEEGWYDEKWKFAVYPVLRELRHCAHRLLIEEGLPAVARWLQSSEQPGWRSHRQSMELVFDPASESLIPRESCGARSSNRRG